MTQAKVDMCFKNEGLLIVKKDFVFILGWPVLGSTSRSCEVINKLLYISRMGDACLNTSCLYCKVFVKKGSAYT